MAFGKRAWGFFCLTIIGISLVLPAQANTDRDDRLDNTFLLRHKDSGKVAEFHNTSTEEAFKAIQAAGLPRIDTATCQKPKFPDSDKKKVEPVSTNSVPRLEDNVMKGMELSILIESFATRNQTELTDPQRDLIAELDLCDQKIRNAIRALALMMQDYELLKSGDI